MASSGQNLGIDLPARVHVMKIPVLVLQKTSAVFIDVPVHVPAIEISHDRIAVAAVCGSFELVQGASCLNCQRVSHAAPDPADRAIIEIVISRRMSFGAFISTPLSGKKTFPCYYDQMIRPRVIDIKGPSAKSRRPS